MELHWRDPADPAVADRWLTKEKDVEVVTLVHCDTPSAVYNQLGEIVTASHGALLIVNAVSSIGAHEILFDQWRVGVLIGGSQKTLNTPPGLTILAVSKAALDRAKEVGGETFYLTISCGRTASGREASPTPSPTSCSTPSKKASTSFWRKTFPQCFRDIMRLD